MYIIYKIYYGKELCYIGRTTQKLQSRLHGHFFKKPHLREIDINLVTKIEYAELDTEADMNLYEIYYINKLKPPLNKDDKTKDLLTIELPELEFKELYYHLMDDWKHKINLRDREYKNKKEENNRLAEVFREQKKIKKQELSYKEYEEWLDTNKTLINYKLDKECW